MEALLEKSARRRRAIRFLIVAFCVTIAPVFIIWLESALNFGDSDLPPYQPGTTFESLLNTGLALLGLPLAPVDFIFSKLGYNTTDSVIAPLFIISGLFWAFIVELVLVAKNRLLKNKRPNETISN